MKLRALPFLSALLIPCLLNAAPSNAGAEVTGGWVLNGPGTESEILLTEEGLRVQGDYDLLVDDPSLSCTPASASRIWANPGSRVHIELPNDPVSITYELFDLRREIPLGDESRISELPSTKNISGTYFQEMGSSFAQIENGRLVIESRNHSPGYIRTSRGIPQGFNTVTTEELQVEGDTLQIKHTYVDDTLYQQPIVLEYSLSSVDATDITLYGCTEADYDWFNELNAN